MAVRLRVKRIFGERIIPSESRDPISFFLVSIAGEGKSEEQYFEGLKEYSHELGLSDIIKVEPLEKEVEYETMSHPNHLLKLLEERKEHWQEWGVLPSELWMVIDRDKQDRSNEQINDILTECEKEGYNVAISNPTFEFWLLLHVTDLKEYDKKELLENRKTSSDKRFLETELAKIIGGYRKEKLDFKKFETGIHDAIQRAYKFENDSRKLVDLLGTNVHHLVLNIIN